MIKIMKISLDNDIEIVLFSYLLFICTPFYEIEDVVSHPQKF